MTQVFLVVAFVLFLILLNAALLIFVYPKIVNFINKLVKGEVIVSIFQIFAFILVLSYGFSIGIMILFQIL